MGLQGRPRRRAGTPQVRWPQHLVAVAAAEARVPDLQQRPHASGHKGIFVGWPAQAPVAQGVCAAWGTEGDVQVQAGLGMVQAQATMCHV